MVFAEEKFVVPHLCGNVKEKPPEGGTTYDEFINISKTRIKEFFERNGGYYRHCMSLFGRCLRDASWQKRDG